MDLTGVRWRKASFSGGKGRNCVEVGVWHKASYSGGNGGGCVEVTVTHETASAPHKAGEDLLYLLRDSKDPDGPKLAFTTAEWDAFIAGVKDGEFDPV
ncbi:MAG TPA: DUF397 domain-containing protein [Streptosporangiaceae bacterium]|nr:DUF397 domain-containing protein [Streptosporangiaceae bacterium]